MTLPNDVARCRGQTDSRDRTAETCVGCERRTAPRSDRQPFMNGRLDGGFCQDRIPSQYAWTPPWIKP